MTWSRVLLLLLTIAPVLRAIDPFEFESEIDYFYEIEEPDEQDSFDEWREQYTSIVKELVGFLAHEKGKPDEHTNSQIERVEEFIVIHFDNQLEAVAELVTQVKPNDPRIYSAHNLFRLVNENIRYMLNPPGILARFVQWMGGLSLVSENTRAELEEIRLQATKFSALAKAGKVGELLTELLKDFAEELGAELQKALIRHRLARRPLTAPHPTAAPAA